jgi:hypothetical protein
MAKAETSTTRPRRSLRRDTWRAFR